MPGGPVLLRRIAIRQPEVRAMIAHDGINHLGAAREGSLMHHRIGRAENPVIGVQSLNPHPGFVRGDCLGPHAAG